jgi:hypothetical protein
MNDGPGGGTLLSVSVDMRHDVVADFFFSLFGHIIVNIRHIPLHFIYLSLTDFETQLFLAFRQRNPKLPPNREFMVV